MSDAVSEHMSEQELREDLAAAFRMLDRHGMSDLTNGSVVARLPGADWYLTHPHGKHFHEMCASDFVAVNMDGTPVNPGDVVNLAVTRCLLYTSPSPRDQRGSRMPSSA